ncbi:ArsR family transcriptional regulator [Thermosediminibacter litoriperuensis]|uniref:ArsR family transcriptional regulator n=1 Tax=Thermosediminibacter litoriperuensis TaxID=291989 RepID=UPI002482D859|nr:ArsR family transcriptional regulator [Thermosediminibacter litoriperuensis]
MLSMLKEKDMTAGEIAAQFDISWPSISHHLNILKQAGMVVDERKGGLLSSGFTKSFKINISCCFNFFSFFNSLIASCRSPTKNHDSIFASSLSRSLKFTLNSDL